MNKYLTKLLLLLFASLLLTAQEIAPQKISLQLQWKHQFEFAGFYAAIEKGFYKDVGLDVSLIEFDKNKDIINQVLTGKADYGLSYSSLIADYYKGKPLFFVANFFKQSPLVLITQKDIKTPADLKNKKIMGLSDTIHNITLLSMLQRFNISTHDIQNVATNFKLDDFINKKIDAMSVFTTNELYYLDKKGIKYNIFDPVVYGAKYYDANLFTSQKEFLEHPQRVKAFREASIKGWEYALTHKDELIEIILKKYNTQNKSKEALLFEANQVEYIMLPNVYDIGTIDPSRVKIILDSFIQAGFLKEDGRKDLSSFIYHDIKNPLNLTKKEKLFLKNKKELRLCIDSNKMPLEAYTNKKYKGINSDFIKIFEQSLPVPIKILKMKDRNESLKAIQENRCDFLSLISKTQQKEAYLSFTTPYLESNLIITAKSDKKSVLDISYLAGKTIAVVSGSAASDILEKGYPQLKLVEVSTVEEGLNKLSNDEVFGYAGSAMVNEYYFEKEEHSNFKTIAYFDKQITLGVALKKENRLLHTILQKMVKNLTHTQKQNIIKKWNYKKYPEHISNALLIKIFVVILLIILVGVYRHFTIKRYNKELKLQVQKELKKSKDKDQMIFHQNKLIAMGEMIENIAHQWRQPLSQVNSTVLLIDDLLYQKNIHNNQVEEKLLEIESLTKYMSKTIDDFKDFFNQNKQKELFTLNEPIDKALSILKGTMQNQHINVTLKYDKTIKCYCFSNELQQVILIILNNAIDAFNTKNFKDKQITIETKQLNKLNIITISDNAGGIKDEFVHKIFEPYFTTKHKAQGTGLGLYLSKIIIEENLNGKLTLQNISNGAEFTITLKENNE